MNREIRAQQIRVIDDEGTMLGVMTVPEALRIAEDRGLDLLEIAPTATPPTCKIMDYGKWKYEKKKQATAARKKQTVVTIKEVQMRPRTDQHDFETKMNHARRFLLDGDKVKVSLRFMGRELAHQELGMEVMQKAIAFVNDLALIESNPKMEGKQMFLMLAPDPVKIKEYQRAHPNKSKQDTKELAELEEVEEDDEE
ncbi:MAG TPA: translation initiation factor IF-3 [Bdellovibrio sp.]|uniref:translation initiation factor IF-3 n=1 Tax=Bdellovibrio sp. TaxID=28201 RepID=UPI002F217F68